MSGKNKNFNDKKSRKASSTKKNNIENINAINILVSKKEPYGNKNSFKFFIGYKTTMHKASTNDWIC